MTQTINQNGTAVQTMEDNPVVVGIEPQAQLLSEAEINQQITTARKYPRSVRGFRTRVLELATLSESVAAECIYALPRGGKVIEGPSVRFAELVQASWGNCRVGGRIVEEGDKFVVAQGAYHDLESNSAIVMEVRRRITDSKGRRYNDDMIGVASAAAVSIAIRNAILRGVPKALWADMYESARKVVAGDFKTLNTRRAAALQAFVIYGVQPDQILAVLGIKHEDDMSSDHLVQLRGMLNALKEGSANVEELFPKTGDAAAPRPEKADFKEPPPPKGAAKPKPAPQPELKTGDTLPPEEFDRMLKLLETVRDAGEIDGMRQSLRETMSPGDYGRWQHAALEREAVLEKTARRK